MAAEKFNNNDLLGAIRAKMNVWVDIINANATAIADFVTTLTKKADLDASNKVNPNQLPDRYWGNVTGSGTSNDPYIPAGGGGQASPEEWLKSLSGYTIGESRCFYLKTDGGFEWGPIPTGNAEKLAGIVIAAGTASVNSVPLSWNGVPDATAYVIQRADNDAFLNAVQVYSGGARNFSEDGLVANKDYWYRGRATASGFSPSDWFVLKVKTAATGDITPPAPTNGIVNDQADTFDFTFVAGIGSLNEYEWTNNSGASYVAVIEKPIKVGNIQAPPGTIGVRLKAMPGTRTASATLYNTSPFTKILDTPLAPTNPVTDDSADTFDWTYTLGFTKPTDYEISVNALDATPVYETVLAKPYYVGNKNLAVGQVAVRVKAVAGVNNASQPLKNTVAFTVPLPPTLPVTAWSDINNLGFTSGNSAVARADEGNTFDYGWCTSTVFIPTGGSGFVMIEMSDPAGATKIGITLGLSTTPVKQSDASFDFRVYGIDNNRIIGGEKGKYPISASMPISENSLARLRADGSKIYAEYSVNKGSTWTILNTGNQPQAPMYIKLFTPSDGAKIKNVTQSGFQVGS